MISILIPSHHWPCHWCPCIEEYHGSYHNQPHNQALIYATHSLITAHTRNHSSTHSLITACQVTEEKNGCSSEIPITVVGDGQKWTFWYSTGWSTGRWVLTCWTEKKPISLRNDVRWNGPSGWCHTLFCLVFWDQDHWVFKTKFDSFDRVMFNIY